MRTLDINSFEAADLVRRLMLDPRDEDCPLGGRHKVWVSKERRFACCPPCHKTWFICDALDGPGREGTGFVDVLEYFGRKECDV